MLITRAVRIRKFIIGCLLATFVCAIVAAIFFYVVFYWPLRKISRSYLCSTSTGVRLHSKNGEETDYLLRSSKGDTLDFTPFATADSTFVYWSWSDLAVSVTRGVHASPQWFHLPSSLGMQDWSANRMTTDGRFVSIDIGTFHSNFVMVLDVKNGKWEKLEVSTARIDKKGTGRIVGLTYNGDLIEQRLPDLRNIKKLVALGKNVGEWDYDFESNKIYFLRNNDILPRVHVRTVPSGREAKLPFVWEPLKLFWQPKARELWVAGCGLWSIPKTPVYSAKGRFIGDMDTGEFYLEELDYTLGQLLSTHFRTSNDR